MTARNTKLNGAELLERLGVPVLAETAPRMVRRVPFVSMQGNGSGRVSASPEQVREYLADLGNPEQDRAAMLRQVNVRPASWFWDTAADTLTLSRRLLGKGFRAWRSSGRRAVPSWQTGDRFPVLSRFRSIPGVFPLAADLPKLGKVDAEGENAPAAYLEQLGAATLNRVRSSSPRWRGSGTHRQRQRKCIGIVADAWKAFCERISYADWLKGNRRVPKRERGTIYGQTPAVFLKHYLEFCEVAKQRRMWRALTMLRRDFRRRVRIAVKTDIKWLRELLRLLREAQATADTYAGYVGLKNAVAYVSDLLEQLPERQEPEQLPRPPDLLPRPPAAPLAPPA